MKRLVFITIITILYFIIGVAALSLASTDFILGVATGAVIADGDSATENSISNISVIYIAPRISERITDPTNLRLISIYTSSCAGCSLKETFQISLRNVGKIELSRDADKYEIIQAIRIIKPNDPYRAVIWFIYIYKNLIIPVEKLPLPFPSLLKK